MSPVNTSISYQLLLKYILLFIIIATVVERTVGPKNVKCNNYVLKFMNMWCKKILAFMFLLWIQKHAESVKNPLRVWETCLSGKPSSSNAEISGDSLVGIGLTSQAQLEPWKGNMKKRLLQGDDLKCCCNCGWVGSRVDHNAVWSMAGGSGVEGSVWLQIRWLNLKEFVSFNTNLLHCQMF